MLEIYIKEASKCPYFFRYFVYLLVILYLSTVKKTYKYEVHFLENCSSVGFTVGKSSAYAQDQNCLVLATVWHLYDYQSLFRSAIRWVLLRAAVSRNRTRLSILFFSIACMSADTDTTLSGYKKTPLKNNKSYPACARYSRYPHWSPH